MVTEFVNRYCRAYNANEDVYIREPFATDVRAGKNSPIYNAHSYHTKVPFQGIEPFIKHYTEPDELILDPFCGSGMTGIAAIRLNRIPVMIDLSPIAVFISKNYCTIVDPNQLSADSAILLSSAKPLLEWLYGTKCRQCGKKAIIEYTITSDKFECPRCGTGFLLWDVAVNDQGEVSKSFTCNVCGKELQKTRCKRTGSDPVRINYRCKRCGRKEDLLIDYDKQRLAEIERRWKRIYDEHLSPDTNDPFWPLDENSQPLWFPSQRMPEGDESRRNDRTGITHVNHFFSTRNLWALSWLWAKIPRVVKNESSQNALKFAFTSILTISSKMGRYGKRTGNVSGTLYIPSLIKDMNVFNFFKRKIWGPKGVLPAFEEMRKLVRTEQPFIVSEQSATDLSNIPSNTIDYVFTDPPFGGNLMYSELNFLWESWLGRFTNTTHESIINTTQGKSIIEYKEHMAKSFGEIYRVLKPGRWMTMVFHNSDGEVWQAIQDGLSAAGFSIGMIGIFDKQQKTFKQVTSSGAVGYDVVINSYKPKATVKNGVEGKTTNDAIIGFLADTLLKSPLVPEQERTPRMLHSKTIGFFMLQNKPLRNLSFDDFQKILKTSFREIDGHWYLPYQRPIVKGQRKLFGYISTEGEAVQWLENYLQKPRKYGDIAPEFFKALGQNKLPKSLQELLHDNFVEENDTWRNPTIAEQKTLVKKLTDKTARQIDLFLNGQTEEKPGDDTLCEWVEFCYTNGLFKEGAALFHYIDEKGVSSETFQKTKKIAEICKLKSWEGS
jgi:16S rRNA G966 N2-methylase RsmD/DNA-directed RNA polymerase subunit RPC12/RpoP